MKRIALALALSLLGVGPALAGDDADAPVRYHSHGMTVIMHRGITPIDVQDGDNAIGKPVTFTCKSAAGCMVEMSVSIKETDTNIAYTCAYLDGVAGDPGCWPDANLTISFAHQQGKVQQGFHTITSVLNSNQTRGQITSWAVEYTIYERQVKGAD